MAYMIADTACVDPRAKLGNHVEIGPYCVVGPSVEIGEGTKLIAHVCLSGHLRMGEGNILGPFVSLGDLESSCTKSPSYIEIGHNNHIAEGVVIRGGPLSHPTVVGSSNRIGPQSFVQRSTRLGDGNTLGSGVCLGQETVLRSNSVLTSHVSTHVRVTIGSYVLIGGPGRVFHDVPPYLVCEGHPGRIRGLNMPSIRRYSLSAEAIHALREAYRLIYRAKLGLDEVRENLQRHGLWGTREVTDLLEAIEAQRLGRHGRARDAHPEGMTREPLGPDELEPSSD